MPASNTLPTSQLLAFLFTDLVDSVGLTSRLGDDHYALFVKKPYMEMADELIKNYPGAMIRDWAGDGFFATFGSVADSVRFALVFTHLIKTNTWQHETPQNRIGIHLGDATQLPILDQTKPLVGQAQNLAARVMGLACGGQILLTRPIFDSAKETVKSHPSGEKLKLEWLNYSHYVITGLSPDDPREICEVGADGDAPLQAPEDSAKARRVVDNLFDVVIPVGPRKIDEEKMKSVKGVKLQAKVPDDRGDIVPMLRQLLECLKPIRARIRRIYLLTNLVKSDDRWVKLEDLIASIPESRSFDVKPIDGTGDQERGLVDGLCKLELTDWFLLHYNDVWPQPGFYEALLNNLTRSGQSGQPEYGGVFACAANVPFNFMSDLRYVKRKLAGNPPVKWVSYVAKPFHRVKVYVERHSQDSEFLHLTNMAIAILSKRIVNAIAKKGQEPRSRIREREFFDILSSLSKEEFYFDVFPYTGEWMHADNDEDVSWLTSQKLTLPKPKSQSPSVFLRKQKEQ